MISFAGNRSMPEIERFYPVEMSREEVQHFILDCLECHPKFNISKAEARRSADRRGIDWRFSGKTDIRNWEHLCFFFSLNEDWEIIDYSCTYEEVEVQAAPELNAIDEIVNSREAIQFGYHGVNKLFQSGAWHTVYEHDHSLEEKVTESK